MTSVQSMLSAFDSAFSLSAPAVHVGTQLVHEVWLGRLHNVSSLVVEHGADINASADVPEFCNHPVTPLCMSAACGHPDATALLLRMGACVNQACVGFTPLYLASQRGHVECVRLLLAAHAATDLTAPDGATPLMIACHQGHARVVECLLQAGASPAARTTDGSALTPADIAAAARHAECVCILQACQAMQSEMSL